MVGVRAAARPPDEDHPYGHRKYETVAAAAITLFLVIVVLEVLRNAFNHLTGRSGTPDVSSAGFMVMAVTIAVNLAVIRYESREAERLGSEVLLADATATRGDVWTSFTVIAALAGARAGRADPGFRWQRSSSPASSDTRDIRSRRRRPGY